MRKMLTAATLLMLCIFKICVPCEAFSGSISDRNPNFDYITQIRSMGRYGETVDMLRDMINMYSQAEDTLRRAYTELVFTFELMNDKGKAEEAAKEALYRFPDLKPDTRYVSPPVEEIIEKIRRQIYGTVVITTTPDSCLVELNNQFLGHSPITVEYVKAGEYLLNISKTGFENLSRNLIVEPGKESTADYSLKQSVIEKRERPPSAGVGGGLAVPFGNTSDYANVGAAQTILVSFNISKAPNWVLKGDIQSAFFANHHERIPGYGPVMYKHSLIRLGMRIELIQPIGSIEPYIGVGGGMNLVWTSVQYEESDGEMREFKSHNDWLRGWNLSAGIKIYMKSQKAIDLNVLYNKIYRVKRYESLIGYNETELEYLTFMVIFHFDLKSFYRRH